MKTINKSITTRKEKYFLDFLHIYQNKIKNPIKVKSKGRPGKTKNNQHPLENKSKKKRKPSDKLPGPETKKMKK